MNTNSIDWKTASPESDFKGRDFSGYDFSGRFLVGADFTGSILHEANFQGCDLSHVKFKDCDLYKANFSESILYVTEFNGSNLTRANFKNSKIYGVQIAGFTNITFAEFKNFNLESRRRHSTRILVGSGSNTTPFGSEILVPDELCKKNYICNSYKFEFFTLEAEELHMQKSQIYHRLKRLYVENHYPEDARLCEYFERFHKTRSKYKYHEFSGKEDGDSDINTSYLRLKKTIVSLLHEKISGYGLMPRVVLRNMVALYLLFSLLMILVTVCDDGSGVLYTVDIPVIRDHGSIQIDQKVYDLLHEFSPRDWMLYLYYTLFSFFSFTFQSFIPYGHLTWISSLSTFFGLFFLALLVSTYFSTIRNS